METWLNVAQLNVSVNYCGTQSLEEYTENYFSSSSEIAEETNALAIS